MEFAKQLKQLRKSRMIKQGDLAQILQVNRSAVGKWETGVNFPTVEVLDKLAEYFGVTTDYLLGRDTPEVIRNNADINLLQNFNKLNDLGKKEANKRVKELTLIPMYSNNAMPIAAHNDAVIDENELRLMQEDIDDL